MSDLLPGSWLPVEFYFDRKAPVVPEGLVRWLEFGSWPLSEPFLEQTIANLRSAAPAVREIDTDLQTLVRIAAKFPEVRPAGLIFHISHCGSTLVSNALKLSRGTTVLSESRAITSLLRSYADPPGDYLRNCWNEKRRSLIHSLCKLFAHRRAGERDQLIIKCTSVDILALPLVRAWWPEVPCLVVVRDPVEVMVANMTGGWWLQLKSDPRRAEEILRWNNSAPEQMSNEEYCARVLGTFLSCALSTLDKSCRVIDYEQIDIGAIRNIADFFGVELTDDHHRLNDRFIWYSKDPINGVQFVDDRVRKRRLVTPSMSAAANRWAMDSYLALKDTRNLIR